MLAALAILPSGAATQIMDRQIYTFVQLDQLEYRNAGPARPIAWEALAWIGGDFTRMWFKSEGERATAEDEADIEVQALYSRLVSPFWEFQFGARVDVAAAGGTTDGRVLLAVGMEGLAPYWFEVEPVLFVSAAGDVSVRLTSSYDVFVTQRLITQARMEINGAVQDVPEFGVGSGLNDVEAGFRLRYEVKRKAAPYVGVNWERKFGDTATMVRASGEDTNVMSLMGGVRLWF